MMLGDYAKKSSITSQQNRHPARLSAGVTCMLSRRLSMMTNNDSILDGGHSAFIHAPDS